MNNTPPSIWGWSTLPTETKLQILRYHLLIPDPITPQAHPVLSQQTNLLSLQLSSKDVHTIASSIYYSENTLRLFTHGVPSLLAIPPFPLGRLVRTLELCVSYGSRLLGFRREHFSKHAPHGFAREVSPGKYALRRVVLEAEYLRHEDDSMLLFLEPLDGCVAPVEVRRVSSKFKGSGRLFELSTAWCANFPNVRWFKVRIKNSMDCVQREVVEGLPGYARIPIRAERYDVVVEREERHGDWCRNRGHVSGDGETCAEVLERVIKEMVELRSLGGEDR